MPAPFDDSPSIRVYTGPILVRRFVVVQQGYSSCICLGIHTHAGEGCAKQNDQDHYAIVHCSIKGPAPLEGETKVVLPPLRIRAEHPSTILSPASRIHFGRFYEVNHLSNVWPLGQVHEDSMAPLLSIFGTASELQRDPDPEEELVLTEQSDRTLLPVDDQIATEVRVSVAEVMEADPETRMELDFEDWQGPSRRPIYPRA